jgi:hypothetical protein
MNGPITIVAVVTVYTSLLQTAGGKIKYLAVSSQTCSVTPAGFECCFKDIYQNSQIAGTDEENSDSKSVLVIDRRERSDLPKSVSAVPRYLVCLQAPDRSILSDRNLLYNVVQSCATLKQVAQFVNSVVVSIGAERNYVVKQRVTVDTIYIQQISDSLYVYDVCDLSECFCTCKASNVYAADEDDVFLIAQ